MKAFRYLTAASLVSGLLILCSHQQWVGQWRGLAKGSDNVIAHSLDVKKTPHPIASGRAASMPQVGFGPQGSLNQGRVFHTATRMADGKVLLAGGLSFATGAVLAHAEIYQPRTGVWTPTGSLQTARMLHTTTMLPNGKVLVVGGNALGQNGELATVERYDPLTGVWTLTGALNQQRRNHNATLLPNGKVLVVGGTQASTILQSAELYDPTTGRWTLTGNLNRKHAGAPAALLPTGKVADRGWRQRQ